MEDKRNKAIARAVLTTVIALVAAAAIAAAAKFIIDHFDGNHTGVVNNEDMCKNQQAMADLEKAGIFDGSTPECEPEKKEEDKKTEE